MPLTRLLVVAGVIVAADVFAATREAYAPPGFCQLPCIYNLGVCICGGDPPTPPCPACDDGLPVGIHPNERCWQTPLPGNWSCTSAPHATCCFCSFDECRTVLDA